MDPLKYQCFDAKEMMKHLEASSNAYKEDTQVVAQSSWRSKLTEHQLLAGPSLPLVALSHLHQSRVFFAMQKSDEAIAQLKACMEIANDEEDLKTLTKEENSELRRIVLDCRHNYELFLAQNSSAAGKEGQSGGLGKRKGGPGDKPVDQTVAPNDDAAKIDRHKL
jgi:hypothetical protein